MNEESTKTFLTLVQEHYSTEKALTQYRKRVSIGLRTWEKTLVKEHFPASGDVLVIGCGAGREVFALEDLGFQVSGTDITPNLLEAAQAIASDRGSRADFRLSDGRVLPYKDNAFNIVLLWSQVLANVPSMNQRQVLLGEAYRVLKHDGMLSFSVHDRQRSEPLVEPDTIISRGPEPGDMVLRDEADDTSCYWHFFDRNEIRILCTEAGFQTPRIWHTSDFGQPWDNVFVVVVKK